MSEQKNEQLERQIRSLCIRSRSPNRDVLRVTNSVYDVTVTSYPARREFPDRHHRWKGRRVRAELADCRCRSDARYTGIRKIQRFLLNTAIYRLKVLTINTLPTKHSAYFCVIDRLKYEHRLPSTCIHLLQYQSPNKETIRSLIAIC